MLVNDGADQLTNGTLFRKYSSNTQFTGVSGRVALDVLDTYCDMQFQWGYLSRVYSSNQPTHRVAIMPSRFKSIATADRLACGQCWQ